MEDGKGNSKRVAIQLYQAKILANRQEICDPTWYLTCYLSRWPKLSSRWPNLISKFDLPSVGPTRLQSHPLHSLSRPHHRSPILPRARILARDGAATPLSAAMPPSRHRGYRFFLLPPVTMPLPPLSGAGRTLKGIPFLLDLSARSASIPAGRFAWSAAAPFFVEQHPGAPLPRSAWSAAATFCLERRRQHNADSVFLDHPHTSAPFFLDCRPSAAPVRLQQPHIAAAIHRCPRLPPAPAQLLPYVTALFYLQRRFVVGFPTLSNTITASNHHK